MRNLVASAELGRPINLPLSGRVIGAAALTAALIFASPPQATATEPDPTFEIQQVPTPGPLFEVLEVPLPDPTTEERTSNSTQEKIILSSEEKMRLIVTALGSSRTSETTIEENQEIEPLVVSPESSKFARALRILFSAAGTTALWFLYNNRKKARNLSGSKRIERTI